MNDIHVTRLLPSDCSALSILLTADSYEYKQHFIPFPTDIKNLQERLEIADKDRYWGIWVNSALAGFFMLRGFDEGYQRPSFGVYIAFSYSGKGLAQFALNYCMSWCQINDMSAMMLKVHPDNYYARKTYEKAGFRVISNCTKTGHTVMEKSWGKTC